MGVRVKVFNAVFGYWAKEENRLDLLNKGEGSLIRGVKEIKEWKHLDWFRHNSEERKYPVVFKPGAVTQEMAKTVKVYAKERGHELAYELVLEVRYAQGDLERSLCKFMPSGDELRKMVSKWGR
jgi:hypothetical protein